MERMIVLSSALLAAALGCNALFGVDDLDLGSPQAATGGSGGVVGAGGAGGDWGTTSSTTTGGSGGVIAAGGAGGVGGAPAPPLLSDRGLVARYYLDEAESGQGPAALVDHGPAVTVDVPINYVDGLEYVSQPTGRGLSWKQPAVDGQGSVRVDSTKIRDLLEDSTQVTVEVVIDASADAANNAVVAMIMANTATDGRVGLGIRNQQFPYLELNQNSAAIGDATELWNVDVVSRGRTVVHVVVDTTLADASQRARLFVDGVPATPHPMPDVVIVPITQNEGLDLCDNCRLNIGNRLPDGFEFGGSIFYVALYHVALTDLEVAGNVAVLTLSDDPPLN